MTKEITVHADEEEPGVRLPGDALVEVGRPKTIGGLEPQILRQEREIMLVAGAEDDRVDVLGRTVGEGCGLAFDPLQQRTFLEILRPLEAHGL